MKKYINNKSCRLIAYSSLQALLPMFAMAEERPNIILFMVDDMKYCGMLNDTDLQLIRQQIIASGTLTAEDVALFFGRN